MARGRSEISSEKQKRTAGVVHPRVRHARSRQNRPRTDGEYKGQGADADDLLKIWGWIGCVFWQKIL